MAYDRIEPFGEQRADLRAGIVACTIANHLGSADKQRSPGDFMPYLDEPETPVAPDDDRQLSRDLRAAFLGLDHQRTREKT